MGDGSIFQFGYRENGNNIIFYICCGVYQQQHNIHYTYIVESMGMRCTTAVKRNIRENKNKNVVIVEEEKEEPFKTMNFDLRGSARLRVQKSFDIRIIMGGITHLYMDIFYDTPEK